MITYIQTNKTASGCILTEIHSITTKVQQTIALRAVRNVENENCASFWKQKHNMADILKYTRYHRQNLFNSTPDASSTSNTKSVLFHQ